MRMADDNTSGALSDACTRCACSVSADCRIAISECNAGCWGLIECASTQCESGADVACIVAMCDITEATKAMAAGTPCVFPCADECMGPEDMDGGT